MSVIKKQTILGTIYSYIGVAVGTLTMALILPNVLSSEEYGLLGLLSRDMLVFIIILGLGFNQAGNRFFKFFRSNEENHRGYLFNALVVYMIGSFIVISLIYLLKDFFQFSENNDNELYIRYYYLLIPLVLSTGLFNLFDNYAKGLYDTVAGTFFSQLLMRLFVLITAIAYILNWVDFRGFMIFWTISFCSPALFMLIHSVRIGNFSLKPNSFFWKSDFRSEFFSFASFTLVTTLATVIMMIMDNRMVYAFLGLGKSGVYSFCLLFGNIMLMSYNANVKASTSIVLDSMHEGNVTKIQQIFTKSAVTQLMFGTVILVLAWVSLDQIFSLVKPEYMAGKIALIIIGLGKLYDLGSGINTLILSYSKYYKYDSILAISFIALLFGLNWYMIPMFGLEGAATASLIAVIYYNTLRNYLIWRFFRIHPYTREHIKILLIGAIILGIGFLLPDISGSFLKNMLSIIYKSLVLSVLFAGAYYYFKISPEINKVLENSLKVNKN